MGRIQMCPGGRAEEETLDHILIRLTSQFLYRSVFSPERATEPATGPYIRRKTDVYPEYNDRRHFAADEHS